MAYPKEIMDAAFTELNNRRAMARERSLAHQEEIARKVPAVAELERQLTQTSVQLSRAILSGVDVEAKIARLRDNNLYMQQRRKALLTAAGYPENYTDLVYTCPDCQDTGYMGNTMCHCMKSLLSELMLRRLGETVEIGRHTFANFDLRYYSAEDPTGQGISPRQVMSQALHRCRTYAEEFTPNSASLFFQGSTGLGKTHLSLAIAERVIERGFNVLYSPAQALISQLERERFRRGNDGEPALDFVLDCDLLILDDLGTEFTTSFSTALIYNIINARLIDRRPTIISTNLTLKEIEDQYSPRIISRIMGGYISVPFIGRDIRTLRRPS